jgi:hypothetical protein
MGGLTVIAKLGSPVKIWSGRSETSVSGRLPAPFVRTETLTEVAGPGPP